MRRTAAELLLSIMRQEKVASPMIDLGFELVIRESA
jgi:DNA-binding LacI/PurR family transcriptional regulator